MGSITLEVNKKVEIIFEDNNMGRSMVQEVREKYFSIAIPVSRGVYYPLNKGDVIRVNYNDGKGNIYGFTSEVIGRKFDMIPLIMVNNPSEVKKIQRRNFVRVDHLVEINYIPLDEYPKNDIREINDIDFKKGYSLDISGGGMRIKVLEELQLNQFLLICAPIGDEDILSLCRIIRKEKSEDKSFIYGVSFDEIDIRVREKLIQFIFRSMRKNIKVK